MIAKGLLGARTLQMDKSDCFLGIEPVGRGGVKVGVKAACKRRHIVQKFGMLVSHRERGRGHECFGNIIHVRAHAEIV
jgi:hypothetical protein